MSALNTFLDRINNMDKILDKVNYDSYLLISKLGVIGSVVVGVLGLGGIVACEVIKKVKKEKKNKK